MESSEDVIFNQETINQEKTGYYLFRAGTDLYVHKPDKMAESNINFIF